MRAQPPASHWIAGAAFDDPAGKALPVHYPATGEEHRPPASRHADRHRPCDRRRP